MASKAALPFAARPPVSAMPKPIRSGEAAWLTDARALASTNAPINTPTTAHICIPPVPLRAIGLPFQSWPGSSPAVFTRHFSAHYHLYLKLSDLNPALSPSQSRESAHIVFVHFSA